ncbi:hypothetical protein [Embleya hyalina]|uniref:Uncharacterized protein n=1 Tax=Embleya hyalina TaxID=516124 RepID=A0A401YHF9_9ACTN|nr:hypothetical protein [Embleya hyalina]GCD94054.1 hypothetical protein EHYA_01710 [Embleya hyalina]
MPGRFEFERAIRRSGLPPLSRLLALTLATWADVDTGVIPDEHQPAQSVLLAATGMAKSSFLTYRGHLVAAGWISYTSPSIADARQNHAQCTYRIHIPAGSSDDLAITGKSPHMGAGSGDDLGRETTQAGSGDDLAQPGEPGQTGAGSPDDLGRETTTRVPGRSSNPSLPSSRPDVEQVCQHLADRIEQNGSRRPRITKKWRDEARRLIDIDGRSVERIIRAIDWCQADSFWRSNVMSMPALRKQYDRLVLKATEQRDRAAAEAARAAARQPAHQTYADNGVF